MLQQHLLLVSLHLNMSKHLLVVGPDLQSIVDQKLWLDLIVKQQFVVDFSHMIVDQLMASHRLRQTIKQYLHRHFWLVCKLLNL